MKKIFGYARVSSKDQNLDRQLDALKKYVPNSQDIFYDKQSGKDFNRPKYQQLRLMLREGDELYLTELDRLGRNKNEIKSELEYFRQKQITVHFLDIPTTMADFSTFGSMQKSIMDMINSILIEVLSTQAENERLLIKKRQQEGIAAAKARGKHLGRPKAKYPVEWKIIYDKWKAKEITAVAAFTYLKLTKYTFYNLVKKYEHNK